METELEKLVKKLSSNKMKKPDKEKLVEKFVERLFKDVKEANTKYERQEDGFKEKMLGLISYRTGISLRILKMY